MSNVALMPVLEVALDRPVDRPVRDVLCVRVLVPPVIGRAFDSLCKDGTRDVTQNTWQKRKSTTY